jgi:hypothetical protein
MAFGLIFLRDYVTARSGMPRYTLLLVGHQLFGDLLEFVPTFKPTHTVRVCDEVDCSVSN